MPVTSDKKIAVLARDPVMKRVIGHVGKFSLAKDDDLYLSLMRAIVGQQLSVKAAATIWERFLGLFKDRYPEPKKVLRLNVEKLRGVGLSYQKAGYIRNIAEFALKQPFDKRSLSKLDDEALLEHLVQIKGVGRWTAEMLLMFSLKRDDIFPKDDLGIRLTMCRLYNISDGPLKLQHAAMNEIAEKWRPYRSLACHYLWRFKDGKS